MSLTIRIMCGSLKSCFSRRRWKPPFPTTNDSLREFPTIEALAAADEEHVLELWAGLGYYSRARNLMAAARQIVSEHGGRIPSDYDDLLRASRGSAEYMAGAILSIAFNKPYPVVDGNVRRVLSRINGWTEDDPKALWDAAANLVRSRAEPRLVNQAMMELGAKVCSFRVPAMPAVPDSRRRASHSKQECRRNSAGKKRPATVHVQLFAVVHKRGHVI